jgi:hypothetical protein
MDDGDSDSPLAHHINCISFFLSLLVRPLLTTHCRCRGLLLHLITLSDTHTHIHSVGHPWTRDRSATEVSTCTTYNINTRQTLMPPVGFEPAIPASERPQTYQLYLHHSYRPNRYNTPSYPRAATPGYTADQVY